MTLEGAAVIVVGGSSGIGLATARAARAQGARVTIAGRSRERLERARAQLGGEVGAVALDVSEDAGVQALFEGAGRVDHVLLTAGSVVLAPRLQPALEALRPALEDRFWGAVRVAKHAAPHMGAGGSITFTSGSAGQRPAPGTALDSASCGAVEALARALALDLAPVRVNALCPGYVDTPLLRGALGARADEVLAGVASALPARRIGRPEDVAHAALFLMTNGYVTGISLPVDGGQRLV
jgi:NAD(P)-dependent dehydrogenase (short-subunit alcohol dehydrogenase family)